MKIKFGSVEYFELLSLQDKLRGWRYDKLDLEYLDKLRHEVNIRVKAAQMEYTESIKKS